ncbi:hypothetical protein NDU88_004880 [Pleurodeles waltl]|uniref:Myb/SANT-like DNA-binding domain-containing protein n=1 Tax=Pleurodeles waltl TaxID=8319 RepID=A0AAV7WWR3_PLEWA|nr:hypothetical protein NDU88_004880 [Pleurodeles waltl]
MATASGKRAPAFTSEELEKLVDGVLSHYTQLYGPPDKQVSIHQKKGIWRAIAKDVRTLGVDHRWSTHYRKRWEDLRRWSKKTAEAQLAMASQRGMGARRTMTPLMYQILAVAYPELDGHLRASQQPQGALSGGGAVAPEQEGAPSHMALEGEAKESEATSGTESEGSSTTRIGAYTSDSDSSDGSSLECGGHLCAHRNNSTWSLWRDLYSALWCPSSSWDPERRSWQPKDKEIHSQSDVRGKDRRNSELRLKKSRAAGSAPEIRRSQKMRQTNRRTEQEKRRAASVTEAWRSQPVLRGFRIIVRLDF